MKKLFLLASFIFLATNLFAVVQHAHHHQHQVGAPLDGGLLAILAALGISYFAARKKSKKI